MQKERAEQLISSLGYKLGYSLCTPVFKFCANCLLKLIILRHGHKLASQRQHQFVATSSLYKQLKQNSKIEVTQFVTLIQYGLQLLLLQYSPSAMSIIHVLYADFVILLLSSTVCTQQTGTCSKGATEQCVLNTIGCISSCCASAMQ